MPTVRCDEVVVQIILRTYDEQGQPLREQLSQPFKCFRSAGDIWPQVDAAVQQMQQATPDEPRLVKPTKRQHG